MKKKQFLGIWFYSILCLILIILYKYYTGIFEPKILNYNMSLWSALVVNVILIIASIVLLRDSKILLILCIILAPISTFSFYQSWTKISYEYLAGFAGIPILLLLIASFMKNSQNIVENKNLT